MPEKQEWTLLWYIVMLVAVWILVGTCGTPIGVLDGPEATSATDEGW